VTIKPGIAALAVTAMLSLVEADTVIAQKTPLAIARDSLNPLVLKGTDGDPLSQDHFAGVAMLSNGSIAYADLYEHRLVLFDSLGKLVATTGRKGAGPGEFENRSRVMRFRGDSIALFDGSLRRVSIFDSRLKFVRTQPVLTPSTKSGFISVEGQFEDGSLVSVARTYQSIDAATGVHTFPRTLVVAEPSGKFRQFQLPTIPELLVVNGNSSTMTKVPMTSVQALAICERGFVVIADSVVKVYDATFRLLFAPTYRGHSRPLSASERSSMIHVSKAKEDERWQAAVDAANPKQLLQYFAPTVSADGMIWYKLGGSRDGRFVRTTPRGDVIDTVLAPYHVYHANGRTAVASGPFDSPGDDAPTVLLRQPSSNRTQKPTPASPLGRCNAAQWY
jgi:hypothetical protein